MALTGPDGETISHLAPTDQRNSHEPGPDRGHWVGPRAGDPLPIDNPESAARNLTYHPIREEHGSNPFPEAVAVSLGVAKRHLRNILENQPMVLVQRTRLLEALHVLDSFK